MTADLVERMRLARVRSMDPTLREHYVYRCFDSEGRLLYIGCSRRVETRMKEHRASAKWAKQVARMKLAGPYTYKVARDLEREATRDEDPIHNGFTPRNVRARQRSRRRFDELMDGFTAQGHAWPEAMRLAGLAHRLEEAEVAQ